MSRYLARLPRPAAIAHRGGSLLRPENTLEAFRHAAALGVDALELDVRLTLDGEVVVFHDALVDRTTDGRGPVESFTLEGLARLDAGAKFLVDGRRPFLGARVPTLEALFAALPGLPMNIEVKSAEPALTERFAALVRRFGREDSVCVGSALDDVAEAVRAALPGVATFFPEIAARAFVMRHKGMELPPLPEHFDLLALPLALDDGFPVVDAALVAAAHAAGKAVHVWTLNDRASIEAALAAGADGVMTDNPALLLEVLGR